MPASPFGRPSRSRRLDFRYVAIGVIIEALKVFKGEVAESKGQFSSACREPEQGNGRDGCSNASGSDEKGAVQQPGLPDLIAELVRSAAGPGGSPGGVDKAPWSFFWKSFQDCAAGAGETAVRPSFRGINSVNLKRVSRPFHLFELDLMDHRWPEA
jgi:hypothetical protein